VQYLRSDTYEEKKENCIGNDTLTGHKKICTVLKGIETEKIMEKSSHATRLDKSDTRQNTQGRESSHVN
jgi:hypothetical protein